MSGAPALSRLNGAGRAKPGKTGKDRGRSLPKIGGRNWARPPAARITASAGQGAGEMSSLRVVHNAVEGARCPCSRCSATGCHWDRVAGYAVCPDCQEGLLRGESAPLVLPREGRACAVCKLPGTIRYL